MSNEMGNLPVRKLSKTSMFTTEILKVAPADLAVTQQSKKYWDLRRDLLDVMTNGGWGLRLHISAETPKEVERQVRNLYNAGHSWERSIQLKKLHGLVLNIRSITDPDKLGAMMDMFFNGIDKND